MLQIWAYQGIIWIIGANPDACAGETVVAHLVIQEPCHSLHEKVRRADGPLGKERESASHVGLVRSLVDRLSFLSCSASFRSISRRSA